MRPNLQEFSEVYKTVKSGLDADAQEQLEALNSTAASEQIGAWAAADDAEISCRTQYSTTEQELPAMDEVQGPAVDVEIVSGRTALPASSFGENNTNWLWNPYIPIGEFTVLMASGGTGKSVFTCGLAAAVSTGKALPGIAPFGKGRNVLFISAEDSGALFKDRLTKCGADLDKVFVLDCDASIGLSFSDGYAEFEQTVKQYHPALVIVDPWHAFIGSRIDINKINAVRPVLQRLTHLAKRCDCAIILVSHVNKRTQTENANNAAQGSADLINASRGALQLIFGGDDEPDKRIVVHTKANYGPYGKSVCFQICDGGLEWDGYSDVTRQTLEAAARRKSTPLEVLNGERERTETNEALIAALEKTASFKPAKFTYEEFRAQHGDLIFGSGQPVKALKSVTERLADDGYFLKTEVRFKKNGRAARGFILQQVEDIAPEQTAISL